LLGPLSPVRDTESVLPIAHAGHWFLWILYAVPVFVVVGSIINSTRRARREADQAENDPDA
jgi:hypothetical protein